jgi:hypothetical protein
MLALTSVSVKRCFVFIFLGKICDSEISSGETANIWERSLMVRMVTGWKPILLYAVARRDGNLA